MMTDQNTHTPDTQLKNETDSIKTPECKSEVDLIKKQGQEMLMITKINEAFAMENKILTDALQNSQNKIIKLKKHFDLLIVLSIALLIIILVLFVH